MINIIFIPTQLLFDGLKRCRLACAFIFGCCANNAACIGDKVRHAQHAFFMQNFLRAMGKWDIRALHHKPGIQPLDIGFIDHIGPGGRNPDITLNANDLIAFKHFCIRITGNWLASIFKQEQFIDIQSCAIMNSATLIRDSHQHSPFVRQKTGGMFTHRAKALNDQTRARQLKITVLQGHFNHMTQAETGRAVLDFKDVTVPLLELAESSSREWLRANMRNLDVERDVKIHTLIRPGPVDLGELFVRGESGHAPLANDTSCGVGFAPLSALESLTLAAEHGFADVSVQVNAADAPERGSIFLTVSGTSAEAGDDGEAGRGNRVNGLITPCRPMTLESVAGKNPISHVGKLYNLLAGLIAEQAAAELGEGADVECYLVSRIGYPIDAPPLAHLRIATPQAASPAAQQGLAELVQDQLASLPALWKDLLDGSLQCDRWPLKAS